jgi:hypothetical protein
VKPVILVFHTRWASGARSPIEYQTEREHNAFNTNRYKSLAIADGRHLVDHLNLLEVPPTSAMIHHVICCDAAFFSGETEPIRDGCIEPIRPPVVN